MLKQKKRKIYFFLLLAMLAFIFFSRFQKNKLTGVYWGAFDPPTEAHAAIIVASFKGIPINRLIVVINNHAYKNYTYPIGIRLRLMEKIIQSTGLENVELFWQDETHKLDFLELRKITQAPMCAIAGYDSYIKWVNYSTPQERSFYNSIAVIPRDDASPTLFDDIAFILTIDPKYKYVSSTKHRDYLFGNK